MICGCYRQSFSSLNESARGWGKKKTDHFTSSNHTVHGVTKSWTDLVTSTTTTTNLDLLINDMYQYESITESIGFLSTP